TSASQSMKEQAQELMRQVEAFKINGAGDAPPRKRDASDSRTTYASRTTLHATAKPMGKKSLGGPKATDGKEPAGVATATGKDRRSKEAEFEEF
ncbi:MAG: hypothetical protein AAB177_16460, partial [Nitrospirota bacterium]